MARGATPNGKGSKALIAAATCIVVAALYLAQEVLIPVALALLLTFLLAPLVKLLQRRHVGRGPAVIIVVFTVFLAVAALGWIVVGQVVDLANSLDQYKGNIITKIERVRSKSGIFSKLTQFGHDVQKNLEKPAGAQSATQPAEAAAQYVSKKAKDPRVVTEESSSKVPNPATQPTKENPLPVAIVQPSPSPLETLQKYLGVVLGPLGTGGIVIVFVIFMLLSIDDLRDRTIRLAGYGQLHATTRALDDAATRISKYLTAQAMVNGTYGVAIGIGLELIGFSIGHHSFPNVLLWGLLCAVLRFIPYIGPWIASAFPLAVAFAVYPSFAVFAAVIGLFLVIELLTNNLMEPWLYGASTGMSAVAILVAAVFWTWLWGPVGLLMSTPLTVCLVVLGKYVPQLGFLDIILGDQPALEPHERVYQRLLAMDQEEAAEMAEEYLATMPMEDVYDKVLLPALAMGEQDRHRGKLDETRKDFVRDSMRDIVDEVSEQHRMKMIRAAAAATEAAARGVAPPEKPSAVSLPTGADIGVVILPAHDPADEIAGTMLANSLIARGYRVRVVSVTALASEMVATVESERADVVVISALPPAAVTHTRYLCKRLHAKFPDIETVAGLWTFKGDHAKAQDRITCSHSVRLVTSLCQSIEQIHQVVQAVLIKQSQEKRQA